MKHALAKFVVSAFCLLALCSAGLAAIYPGSNAGWLVVASRDNPNTAIAYAQQLAVSQGNVAVFQSNNGWYAITLGWADQSAGGAVRNRLVSQGIIPSDSYFHSGERFVRLIWSTAGVTGTNRRQILGSTRLGYNNRSVPAPTRGGSGNFSGPGYVTNLSPGGDGYLSFRAGPSTTRTEIRRLAMNTPFQILGESGGWYNVRLQTGQIGWVYGKYVGHGVAPTQVVAPRPLPVVPAPAPVAPAPAPPQQEQIVISEADNGTKLEVSGLTRSGFDYLALRKGPGDSYLEVARLKEKTKLVVTGRYKDWYRVKPAPSVEGWVKSEFVRAAEVPTFGPPETAKPKPEKPETVDIVLKPDNSATGQPDAIEPRGKRVALVLGNSAYEHTTALPNPKNDADKIAEKLKSLGFTVIVGLDGTKSAMESSIRDFVRILPDSEAALFFYAGHAMQVKGENYLIPIDAKLEDSTAIDFETINLASILQFVDQPGRISIALLDACRDNPLSRTFARSLGATRSAFIGRGLASPASTGNLLIGFATAPGEVALDGDGENSPFTTALLKHIGTPKLEVEAMLKLVRSDVYTATSQRQSPWVNSGLRKNFFFNN